MLINKSNLQSLITKKPYRFLYILPFVIGFVNFYTLSNRISLCFLINLIHIPCPFCGLTRAFGEGIHLHFAMCWQYNPLFFLIAPLLLTLFFLNMLPEKQTQSILIILNSHIHLINSIVWIAIGIILLFGTIRVIAHLSGDYHTTGLIPQYTLLKWINSHFTK